jgi:hypothetical protein
MAQIGARPKAFAIRHPRPATAETMRVRMLWQQWFDLLP